MLTFAPNCWRPHDVGRGVVGDTSRLDHGIAAASPSRALSGRRPLPGAFLMEHRPVLRSQPQPRLVATARQVPTVHRLLASNRFVLGAALVLVGTCTELLHLLCDVAVPTMSVGNLIVEPALVAVLAAVLVGHLSLASITGLPLVSVRGVIISTFAVSFGGEHFLLQLLGVDVDFAHLLAGFAATLGWYLIVAWLRSRHVKPVMALVGVSRDAVASLPGNVQWQLLERPELRGHVTGLVVDPHASLGLEWSRFITQLVLDGVPVYHRSHLEEGLTGKVRFTHTAENDFGALLPSLAYLRVKRGIDLLGVALALPLVLPIMLAAALAIRLDGPGPVIFAQRRMGHRGRPFTCYKLRTMTAGHAGPAYTVEGDARITRVGRYLRKWRIDELPQIWNVARGDMSWIGPRPEALELALDYAAKIPFYDYRHAVRPGITGWAAVHQGNVGEVEAAREKLEYDFFYIRYFSLSLDFLTALKTIQTIASGFGSR